jgi:hypothetical protein
MGEVAGQISSLGKSGSYNDMKDYPQVYTVTEVDTFVQLLREQVNSIKAMQAELNCNTSAEPGTNSAWKAG